MSDIHQCFNVQAMTAQNEMVKCAQPDTPMRDHNCMRGAIRLCNIYEIVRSVLCVVLYNILMQNATMFQSTAYIQVATTNIP